ncbi:hypothetical protein GQ44DRAFT_614885, partial [Phaeosphaeriaceae sp. PMI808]
VGGSLSGLMHGIVLRNTGCNVRIIERSAPSALQSQAADIRAGPELQTFLENHVPNLREYATTADVVEIMDCQGDVVQRLPLQDPLRLTAWYQTRRIVQNLYLNGDQVTATALDVEKDTVYELEVDVVVAADDAYSAVRSLVAGDVRPRYAGYTAWRGPIPEPTLSIPTREALRNRCMILRVEGGYQISYYVPSEGGVNSKERDFVWIRHDTLPEDSPLFNQILTDIDGSKHKTTIPTGKTHPVMWAQRYCVVGMVQQNGPGEEGGWTYAGHIVSLQRKEFEIVSPIAMVRWM